MASSDPAVFEFGRFRLDVAARELRLGDREVALQPRAFDVLVYLVRHRDRVVGKHELLDTLWPDVVVSDGSLKRAVSLARTALREGGQQDAIRTYSRQGYRFHAEVTGATVRADATGAPGTAATDARGLFAARRWADAAQAFAAADAAAGLDAPDLEHWAEALLLGDDPQRAAPMLERAVAAYGARRDARGVARAALTLAQLHFEQLDLAIARAWLRRAERALPVRPLTPEHGQLAGLRGRFAVGAGDFEEAIATTKRALEIGRELDDLDVEVYALSYLGIALIASGDVERGLRVHEDAAALVLSGRASPITNGVVYCGLIWTCRNREDWERAGEWNESFSRWCEAGSLAYYSGNCRLHRADVLHHRGDLDGAEREATRAAERLPPYAQGDAWRAIGDLRLAQRDIDAAERAYHRSHELGWDPQPGLALVMVARGRAGAGLRGLEHSLHETTWANRQRHALLLATLVEVALATGEVDRARAALAELDDAPQRWSTSGLRARVQSARAALAAHDGDHAEAIRLRRDAVRAWHRIGSPLHLAAQRLELARVYAAAGDLDAAELEVSAARAALADHDVPGLSAEVDRVAAACGERLTER